MLRDAWLGLAYLWTGFGLIRRPGLRRYVALPLAVNALVFGTLLWLGTDWFARVLDDYLPQWLDFALLKYLLWALFAAGALLLLFYAFALLANFIAAPFNGLLAERVEQLLTGHKPPSSGRVLAVFATVLDAVMAEVRKLLYLLAWMLPFAVLLLVPGVNLLAAVCWFLLGSWMLALEYLDYPAGNHQVTFRTLRRRLGERRWLAFGFGAGVVTLTAVPLVNLVVMPAAVAGATALWVEQFKSARRSH